MENSNEQFEIPVEELEKVDGTNDKKADSDAKEPEIEIVKEEKAAESAKNDDVDPNDGIKALKEQLERERSMRIEAEKAAKHAAESAYVAKNEAHDTNLTLLSNAIDSLKQNNEILKAHYRAARESGDIYRETELQQEMSSNAAKLLQLEQGKEVLEKTPKPQREAFVSQDPVEALASQLSSRSADWVRRNPDFARDPKKYQKMIAAHQLAVADGISPDTDDYFDSIETTLRIKREQPVESDDDASYAAAKVTQRRTSPPAAPVSRSGNGTGSRPNVVRLNADEREMASLMGMTDQEYAKSKLQLQREGRLK